MTRAAAAAAKAEEPEFDDDVTQGPDKPAADDEENGLALDAEEEDEEEEEGDDKKAGKQPTVAELQTQLTAARARATAAARQVSRERQTRKAGGVNAKGKAVNGKGAEEELDPQDRSSWPEAARKAVEAAEAKVTAAESAQEQTRAKAIDKAIKDGLIAAGLKLPEGTGQEAEDKRRLAYKRVLRQLDIERIEVDADGDIVGVEDEIALVVDLFPGMFGEDAAKTAAERAAVEDGLKDKKPTVNPGGGPRKPAGASDKGYASTAAFLVSPEYANRNRIKK